MKRLHILSMGILGILLTSCGGGSTESENTATSDIAHQEEEKADPEGIGEFKSVEVGERI